MPTKRHRPIVDWVLEAADSGLKVFPLQPLSKLPAVKGWPEWATTNTETILAYWQKNPTANYGILTGPDSDLLVIDVDGPRSSEWFGSFGFLSTAQVKTASGTDHTHHYFATPPGFECSNSVGKLYRVDDADHVDVRGYHGFVVGPGSMTPSGTYRGDITRIPDAPAELLAMIPERQVYTHTPPERVEKADDSSAAERRSVAWIIESLEALPRRKWQPGDGWHDTVMRAAGWLSRMVNSNDYAMTESSAVQILLDHTPVWPEWGEDKIIEQWESMRKATAGQYADPPGDDEIPAKLPLLKAQEGAPEYTSTGGSFLDLVTTLPKTLTDGALWDRRHQIFLESFRAELPMQTAFSLAAGSLAAESIMREAGGDLVIYKEAKKALAEVQRELPPGEVDPEHVAEVVEAGPMVSSSSIPLITDVERELLGTPEYRWWGTRYLEWINASLKLANMPYHRLHLWLDLSVIFGFAGYVPTEGKRLGLNLWGVLIGRSSTGKSEALDKAEDTLAACFPRDESPNIGSDATTEAMHDALIFRDGKPSYMVIDEAHGLLTELANPKSFRGDLITRWTDWYEGKVRASLRSSKKDISGKTAQTSFSLLLQGTPEKMRKALNQQLWEQGFLPRALFTIGENIEVPEEFLDTRLVDGDADRFYNAMPRQWAAEFQDVKRRLERIGDLPVKIDYEPAALLRHNMGMRQVRHAFRSLPNQDAVRPYANRFVNQLLKMASLVALTEARAVVSERDVVIALAAAEEFLGAAAQMAKLAADSEYALRVDAVERLIAEKGGSADMTHVYRALSEPAYEVDRLIDQLVRERRIRKLGDAATNEIRVSLMRDAKREEAA